MENTNTNTNHNRDIFHAIAEKDYNELINLYSNTAVNALYRYQSHRIHSRESSREEKLDEFFHQLPNSGTSSSSSSNNGLSSSTSTRRRYNNESLGYTEYLREFTVFRNHPEIVPATGIANAYIDADRLVQDAVASLSDSRPAANFILYKNNNNNINNNTTTATTTDNELDGDSSNSSNDSTSASSTSTSSPPIFDGSVANATPSLMAGHGGGIGTALHVATALDHPLTLALLLVMGGDARSVHTAFRRLIIHEAACNGSIQCLQLLLEIGTQYRTELKNYNSNNNNNKSSPSIDFACLPRTSTTIRPLHHYYSYATTNNNTNTNTNDIIEKEQPSVLSLLRLFQDLVVQVHNKQITELHAARTLIKIAPLSDTTKVTLSRVASLSDGHGNTALHWAAFKNEIQCVSLLLQYNANPNARAHPSGWTPLHDAAYSNGKDSISLLLDAGAEVDARANSGATPLCFAAQEDAANAAELLLCRGADLSSRCCSTSNNSTVTTATHQQQQHHSSSSRFSGYTPLHYCAHYNASKAANILLQHHAAAVAMEIVDLNNRLPIHVAVARGSSDVLRELLRAGARVETRPLQSSSSSSRVVNNNETTTTAASVQPIPPVAAAVAAIQQPPPPPPPPLSPPTTPSRRARSNSTTSLSSTSLVSSPVLRSLIPSQPVQSSKPWNCLSQRSIDECRQLITEVESNWTPNRHTLFTPADRRAVAVLLRVGKRLELDGSMQFVDLWPEVLSFCGRGWFETDEETSINDDDDDDDIDFLERDDDTTRKLSLPTFC